MFKIGAFLCLFVALAMLTFLCGVLVLACWAETKNIPATALVGIVFGTLVVGAFLMIISF